jgi:hypothetical protein
VKFIKRFLIVFSLPIALVGAGRALGQSTDQALPTAVLSNEIEAKIAPLDLGDARVTRHYYAFEGTPGDLEISINSRNLNGDMDVFTAVTFRPLMKISFYANTIPPVVNKSIYLRTKQILILRVEARTPNDEAGSYRIRFGGTFAAFSGGIPVAENAETQTELATSGSGTRRVSSVGATINEPPPETPTATPETSPSTEVAAEKPAEETEKKPAAKPARTKPARSTSTARNPRRRTPPPTKPRKSETETAGTEKGKTDTEAAKIEGAEAEEKPAVTPVEKPATEEKPAQEPVTSQAPGARLIIEEKDGTRIDRPMSTIRRIVVEGGTIVIVLKTGRSERIPMSAVARMAIEP